MALKRIVIKKISLQNFKGIKDISFDFKDEGNCIYGDNATGKTTIADSFSWLLFDKDTTGRSDFAIKPFTFEGQQVHKVESIVEATILVNDEPIELKKVYREKYTKPRGTSQEVFSGHETIYYYNNVPQQQKEYQKKIEDICPERIFKLLTNPLYFAKLPWQDQRTMLFRMAGDVNDADIASGNKAYEQLLASINGKKSIDEYKKEIAAKKRMLKDDLDKIPARIDEVNKSLPMPLAWAMIEKAIEDTTKEIEQIDAQIADSSKNLEIENRGINELQSKINALEADKRKLERDAAAHIENLLFTFESSQRVHSNKINGHKETISQNEGQISKLKLEIEALDKKRQTLRAEWEKINAEKFQFDEIPGGDCPYCGQKLPEEFLNDDRNAHEEKFNADKAERIAENVKKGKAITVEITAIQEQCNTCNAIIDKAKAEIEKESAVTFAQPNYEEEKEKFLVEHDRDTINGSLNKLYEELGKMGPAKVVDTTTLQANRKELQAKLDSGRIDLLKRDQIAAGHKRIEELTTSQQTLSQELANLEKIEMTIQEFQKARITELEQRINSMFHFVTFKMYNQQVNGGEVETCECTMNGTPYSDLNTAGKIQAGLDIINALSQSFGIYATCFLDNRESVIRIPEMKCQIISLIVQEGSQLMVA